MFKINKYKLIKIVYYLLHIYLLLQIISKFPNAWDDLYLPILFTVTASFITYIINTQSSLKSSFFLIYFLLSGSLAFLTSFLQTTDSNVAIIIFTISFQLTAWFFNKFVTEILFNRRIIYRKKNKIELVNIFLLCSVIGIELFSIYWQNGESVIIIAISTFYFFSNIFIPLIQIAYFIFKNKEKQNNTFLAWMLLIPIIAFSPFLFLFLLPFLFNQNWIDPYTIAWAFFILPIGYTYLILTQRLININFILNRTIYYGGLAFIPSSFLIFLLFLLHPEMNLEYLIQIFIILFFFNIMFFFIKEQIDFKLRNSLFRGKYNIIQSIEGLIKDLENCRTTQDLNNVINLNYSYL